MLRRAITGLVLMCALAAAVPALAKGAGGRPVEAEEHAATAAPAHGAEQGPNWFDMSDAERPALGFMFINFAVVAVAVFIILKGPIGRRVAGRRAAIVTALDEANAMRAEAEKALAEARARMEMLEVEMARIREDLLSAGKAEAARIGAEAEKRAARMQEDARVAVQQELAQLTQAIREETVQAVIAAAERAIKQKISAADHVRLSNDYVESLRGAEPRAPGR